ncbi:MAG: acetate--CoA ligase family protein [Planctomycetes bacterium]|nr:acetate--CoA ligase family protein [Planctomycetota bacterium]
MNVQIDFQAIDRLFANAMEEDRDFLFEYEVYDLLKRSGSETPPNIHLLLKGTRPSDEEIQAIPGNRAVLKIISPTIIHKTEVGGVKIVDKNPSQVRSAWRRMMYEVPERYTAWIERHGSGGPAAYRGLTGQRLEEAIARDIRGAILCQYMPPDSHEFGNELIVGIRSSREFGMIISAGLGGTDTELYASRFKKGQAVVAASTELTSGETFFELFRRTISYKKLAGLTRGQKRVVTDEQLLECFSSFIKMANYYSPTNPDAPYVIDELEINPFAFTDYLMVPLDGLCKFSKPQALPVPRPLQKIDNLLHPKSIGVIGVSSKGMNVGRIILQNILANGFDRSKVRVIRPGLEEIDGVRCVPDLDALDLKLGLFVLAVDASQIPDIVEEVIDKEKAESVLLIPGGLGEKKGSEERSIQLKKKINAAHGRPGGGPVFLGGNSLGILSHPGHYDTLFIPEAKLPKIRGDHLRKCALISQSGAYMITRMSKLSFLDPAYALSIGNQTDLTAGDLLNALRKKSDLQVLAIYMEGFADLDGLAFAKAVREAVLMGKDVLFYKAGRTPEGKSATSGHTASLAGDYMVCESCVKQAGALVAQTFTEFEDLIRLALGLHDKKVSGNRIAALSNAGYESVGMADNILGEDFVLEMAPLEPETRTKLEGVLEKGRLQNLVDVKNPMDVTPMATDAVYEAVIEALIDDASVDAVVAANVPLSPVMQTLPEGILPHESVTSEDSVAQRIPNLAKRFTKPIVTVVDSGELYDPLAQTMESGGLVVFRSADRAVWTLGKYIEGRLFAEQIRRNNGPVQL